MYLKLCTPVLVVVAPAADRSGVAVPVHHGHGEGEQKELGSGQHCHHPLNLLLIAISLARSSRFSEQPVSSV